MPASVTAKAADLRAETAAIQRETAAAYRRIAEQDARIAYLADEVARREAARAELATAPAPAVTSDQPDAVPEAEAPPAPPDPAAEAWAREDAQISGLAILAREPGWPEKGSRVFWRAELDRLGRHLAPDASPASQRHIALADPRGKAFLEAMQQCP